MMKELFKYPSLLLSITGAMGVFIGFGSSWATQISRIDSLEKTFAAARAEFVTKDQLATVLEMLKRIEQKIDLKSEAIEDKIK